MKNGKSLRGKSFSILGDSYSTFHGYIPGQYSSYYPAPESVADVLRVQDTWWYTLMKNTGMRLLVNDSYSGSTVCTQVRQEHPDWVSYVHRARMVEFGVEQQPEYILVFGGTNDSWLEREIGQPVYAERTEAQLESVLPAFCQVLETLTHRYPAAQIVTVINTDLDPRIRDGMCHAAGHYRMSAVVLENIEKQNGHPTATGMASIARQIEDVLQKM